MNSYNIDNSNMMMLKNNKKQHNGGYEHNKLPMSKKIGGNDMSPIGQNNSSVLNHAQQQRPVSY